MKWFDRIINWWERLFSHKKERDISVVHIMKKRVKKRSKPMPDVCEFVGCKKRLSIISGKECKYCGNFYCIKHLAPAENHKCPKKLNTIPASVREMHGPGGRLTVSSE
jgi:hypothetical protein